MSILAPARDHSPAVRSRDIGDHPVPLGREEEWRFAPLSRLNGLHLGTVDLSGQLEVSVEADPSLSVERVSTLDPRVGRAFSPTDIVAAQGLAATANALIVTIPAEAEGVVRIRLTGQGVPAAGHVVIDAQRFSRATVVVEHHGSASYAGGMEVLVGDGAHLTVLSLQAWNRDAVHVGQHQALLGRDSRLLMGHVTLGGDVVRISPTINYAAPGGEAELLGLYFADAGQHQEHRVFVDHDTPHCRSSVLYKGALQGQDAHTVWIGDVLVRSGALGIDTYEVNRNLILSDGARADSVPNLELETGEISGAGHASATGRFDDEQLFYLRSRGIPEELARVLVVRGFFADVLGRLGLPDVTQEVMREVDARLGVVLEGTGLVEVDD